MGKYTKIFVALAAFAVLVLTFHFAGSIINDPGLTKLFNTPLSQVPLGYFLLALYFVLYWVIPSEIDCNCDCHDDDEEEEEEEQCCSGGCPCKDKKGSCTGPNCS